MLFGFYSAAPLESGAPMSPTAEVLAVEPLIVSDRPSSPRGQQVRAPQQAEQLPRENKIATPVVTQDKELELTDIVLDDMRIGPLRVMGTATNTSTHSLKNAQRENGLNKSSQRSPRNRKKKNQNHRVSGFKRPTNSEALVPRLHKNPGRHTLLTARRMVAQKEKIKGSCYRYLSEVFARAGHDGWRTRRVVYRGSRKGPFYANLSLVKPGDWLYIVKPYGDGTHSVMFVSWMDRSRAIANTISHPGWGAPTHGREASYDISKTYRIIRAAHQRK